MLTLNYVYMYYDNSKIYVLTQNAVLNKMRRVFISPWAAIVCRRFPMLFDFLLLCCLSIYILLFFHFFELF